MAQNTRNTEKAPETEVKTKVEGATRKAPEAEPAKGGAFTVTLGFSSLMTALTALVGCVVVAFMMGVIVGRDDVSSRPTLAEIAEEQDAAVAAALAAAKNAVQGQNPSQNKAQAEAQAENSAQSTSTEKVMTAEELKYATALKGKNTPAVQSSTAAAPPPTITVSPASAATGQATAAAQPVPTTPAVPVDPATILYDFEYQVASLKDEGAVDKLRAKLEGEGLRTRMSKIGGYLKVSVHMRGTTAQGQALEQRMVELKLGKPVLQGKKTVTP